MTTWGDGIYWDVARGNSDARHVILRGEPLSMCGELRRSDVKAYVGAHNSGAFASCSLCKSRLRSLRNKREKEMQSESPDD